MPHVRANKAVGGAGGGSTEPLVAGDEAPPTDVPVAPAAPAPDPSDVEMVSPDGTRIAKIAAGDLERAHLRGYRLATPEDSKAATDLERETALDNDPLGKAQAVAGGVLQGATFNLAEPALRKLGATHIAENIEKAKENHPYLYTGSAIGGGVLSAAAAPEIGALKAVTGGGRLLKGALVGSALAETYSMGDHLNEYTLGKPAPTAQKLIHEASFNVLTAGLGSALLEGLAPALTKNLERANQGVDDAEEAVKQAVATAKTTPEDLPNVSRNIASVDQDTHDVLHSALDDAQFNGARARETASLVNKVPLTEAQGNVAIWREQIRPLLEEAVSKPGKYDEGIVNNFVDAVARADERVRTADSSADVLNGLMGDTKSDLMDSLKKDSIGSAKQERAKDLLYGAVKSLNENTRNTDYWGPAGARNEAWDAMLHSLNTAEENHLPLVADLMKEEGHFDKQYKFSSEKAQANLVDLASGGVQGDKYIQTRIPLEQARREALEQLKITNNNASNVYPEADLKGLFDRGAELRDQGVPLAKPQVPVTATLGGKALQAAAGVLGYKAASALGAAVGGPAGFVAGMAGGKIARSIAGKMLNGDGAVVASTSLGQQTALARLNMMAARSDQAISQGIKNFFSGTKAALPAAANALGKTLSPGGAASGPTPYHRRAAEIRALADPTVLSSRMAAATSTISQTAPNITMEMQAAGSRGIQFLHNLLAPQITGDLLQDKKETPSATQEYNLAQAYPIVNKPIDILKVMREGTMEPLQVAALQTVYPELHDEIRNRIGNYIIDNPTRFIPPAQATMLSMFLGVPVKAGFGADFAQWIQGAAAAAPSEQSAMNLGALKGDKPNSQVAPLTKSLSLEAAAYPRSA